MILSCRYEVEDSVDHWRFDCSKGGQALDECNVWNPDGSLRPSFHSVERASWGTSHLCFMALKGSIQDAGTIPDILLLHCGTNDIGLTPHHLIHEYLRYINYLKESFPQTVILWSDIFPRKKYSVATSTPKVDKVRKKINKYARSIITGPNGGAIEHTIQYKDLNCFIPGDEAHLSEVDNALVIEDWSNALKEWLVVWR